MASAYAAAIERMAVRIRATAAETGRGFPHYADSATGIWTRSPNGDWTGGFWVGELWLLAYANNDQGLRLEARAWARALRSRSGDDTIFRGFLFWYGAALGAILEHDPVGEEIALQGAGPLSGLYSPEAGLLPLGSSAEEAHSVGYTEANIDGVPAVVPLLVWAGRQTGAQALEPAARSHVRRHLELCVRADGSVCQSATFDPATGALVRRYTHKGVTDESTWTRAQSWAMLGLAHAVRWLGPEFVPVAIKVADWWIEHLPADHVAFWDFDAPGSLRDTSGTATAAAALLKLAILIPERAGPYRAAAEAMVGALVSGYLTPTSAADARPPGILTEGCYNHRIGLATSNELIWGDYFLLESLLCLDGRLDPTRL